ncbi:MULTISPECIES: protein-arginine deiminase family protein [Streptomyces]|uniref:protein-arginine deiminase family protein n=1 Tax=Streptomyces TaxID=1883 RepID=UPI00186AD146|nr:MULTISPECIES: protein-arginine deiminase family protein [Streptomyces]
MANYLLAIANGPQPGTDTYLSPQPHAPADAEGRDVFQRATEEALAPHGVDVAWVDDWQYAHGVGTVGGNVHCVTNAFRQLPDDLAWWR